MPFDSLGPHIETESVTDPLERLGITPVPPEFVNAYMKEYREKFLAGHPPGPGPFTWRRIYPRSVPASHRSIAAFMGLMSSIEQRPFGQVGGSIGSAPRELVDLAEQVRREIPDAEFSIDYFDRDPIVNVAYGLGAVRREVCLGIWDKGEIKAIAGTRGAAPETGAVPPASVWGRLFRR